MTTKTYVRHILQREMGFPPVPVGTDFAIKRVVRTVRGSQFRVVDDCNYESVVALMLAGTAVFVSAGRRFVLTPGMVYLQRQGSSTSIRAASREFELHLVAVDGGAFVTWLDTYLAGQHAFSVAHPHRIEQILQQMMAEARSGRMHRGEICSDYLRILVRKIADERSQRSRRGKSTAFRTYLACQQTMDEQFLSLGSIAEVAEAHGITTAYLWRLFKECGGCTPSAYLRRRKMDEAAELLATTPLLIREIADRLGYADQYVFSKSFRHSSGLSPSEFRHRHSRA